MNFRKRLFVTLGLALISKIALGHPGGHSYGPPVKKEEVVLIAIKTVEDAVAAGKLEKSWKDIKLSEPEEKTVKGMNVWLLKGNNPKITDKDKQNIYLYLGISGEVMGAAFKPFE